MSEKSEQEIERVLDRGQVGGVSLRFEDGCWRFAGGVVRESLGGFFWRVRAERDGGGSCPDPVVFVP